MKSKSSIQLAASFPQTLRRFQNFSSALAMLTWSFSLCCSLLPSLLPTFNNERTVLMWSAIVLLAFSIFNMVSLIVFCVVRKTHFLLGRFIAQLLFFLVSLISLGILYASQIVRLQ